MTRTPAHVSRTTIREALAQVRAERGSLEGLSREIEPEFVKLANTLGELSTTVSSIAAATEQLRRTAVASETARAGGGAHTALSSVEAIVGRNLNRLRELEEGLRGVGRAVTSACAKEKDFDQAVTSFWVLKTSFRVEAGVIPSSRREGIMGLTVAMDEVYEGLRQVTSAQFSRLRGVSRVIESLEADLRQVDASARELLGRAHVQAGNQATLAARAFSPVVGHGELVSAQAAEGAERVSAVLVSLQVPDIVRQKVEHMVESIGEIETRLGRLTGAEVSLQTLVREGATVHLMARVQLSQLSDARAEIERAGADTVDGLKKLLDVARVVHASATQLHDLAKEGAGEVRRSAVLVQELRDLHKSVTGDIDVVVARIRLDIIAELRGLVEDLSSSVKGKTEDVRMVALNASAQASRVRGARTLVELATLTAQYSGRVSSLTETMLARARAIVGDIESLQRLVGTLAELAREDEETLRRAESGPAAELTEEWELVLHGLGGTGTEFRRVRAESEAAVTHLQFMREIGERFAGAAEALLLLVAVTEPLFSLGREDPEVEASLNELEARYTMQRERDLHAVATEHTPAIAYGEASDSPSRLDETASTGFGSNVELF